MARSAVEERQRPVPVGLDRFALFVADWEPDEVRTLTALLDKLERSKAAVPHTNSPPPPRRPRAQRRQAPRSERSHDVTTLR